jgi:hypothetical protein
MITPVFIGILGMLMILVAFAMNLFKKMKIDDISYNVLNFAGGGLLAYYAMVLASIPFLILQLVWAFFALYKLVMILLKK